MPYKWFNLCFQGLLMKTSRNGLTRKLLFITALLVFAGVSVYGQSAYQVLRAARKIKAEQAGLISRHIRAPITSAPLAKRVASLRNPSTFKVFSDYQVLQNKKHKQYIPRINVVAEYNIPLLKDPSSLWGSYRYLRVLTSLAREHSPIDPAYQSKWDRIHDVTQYRGVHHIVNKTTLKHIYENMRAEAFQNRQVLNVHLPPMQNDAPGALHPFHGKEKFGYIFHNSQRQLELYEKGGIKLVLMDYFKSIRQLAKDYPQEAPALSFAVVKNTMIEAQLWCETYQLRWE